MGRPRKTLPVDGYDVIRRLAENGVSEVNIAAALGMTYKTWKNIRDEDPDARAAWEEARAIEESRLVGALYRQALGAPAEHDEAGNQLRAEQVPCAPAAMFLLKARHGYREQGVPEGDGLRVGVQINLPASLTPEQYHELVTVTSGPAPALPHRGAA